MKFGIFSEIQVPKPLDSDDWDPGQEARVFNEVLVDAFNFLIQCGNRPHEVIMESLELFAKEVMPEFKERHHLHQKRREQQLDRVKHASNLTI